ncbi:MAG: 3-hydroxyacyl-CoA dehydrogenase/enoyl-CoA hydratase family protein [Pseudomonadales bacterium]|nr:3-hydroxyacyl-CoA dehydrogenase/enoyl-CoA hydratase family protein [Pseudomonadales bacterium]
MSVRKVSELSKIAVVGAGTMGAAISQHFLMKGLQVTLLDLSQSSLEKGLANIETSLQEAVERRILSAEKEKELRRHLSCTTEYSDLADSDFVVEAVFEDMAVKQKVFRDIEANVSNDCIIASNTSSFSITELGSVLQNQSRFLGVHYFYHAAKNKLIEIIPGRNTAPERVEALVDFYYAKDKAPIVVADVDGFAVNRFFVPWLNEATRLLEEGLGSIAFIDQVAMDLFNIGMGPFALMNATGVPIAMHSAQTLADRFGPMYAPSKILKEQVAKGEPWDCEATQRESNDLQQVSDRLLAMSLGVAAQLVSEGVASVTDTDLGARLGLRWPLGPFELMNQLGVAKSEEFIGQVFAQWDQPLPKIFSEIDKSQGFKIEHVKAHVIGATGLIEFNRPDAMNALNPLVVDCLTSAFEELDSNLAIEKIVLFGRGKAFVAGADIKFFVDNIENHNLQSIYDFTVAGQSLLTQIAKSTKQTIAFLDGLALGGGLELALACDHRVATQRLAVAFPETGIGIYPGLGGTQRTPRLIGKGLAKYLIATGAMVNAETALSYGLTDAIVAEANTLEDMAALQVSTKQSPTLDIEEQAFDHFNGELTPGLFEDSLFKKYEKALKKKAPIALKKAMQLVDQGAELPLEEALQLELDGLFAIFSSKDAYAGLSGIITGKPATFVGE